MIYPLWKQNHYSESSLLLLLTLSSLHRDKVFLLNILSISLLVPHFCVYSPVLTLLLEQINAQTLCLNLLIHLYMILFLSLLSILCKMMPGNFCIPIFLFIFLQLRCFDLIIFTRKTQADSCTILFIVYCPFHL